jgi:hypothetical protein
LASGLLITKRCFSALGGFDERLSGSEDWDFLFRLLAVGKIVYIDEPLFLYREHKGGLSRNLRRMEHDVTLAYRSAFENNPELNQIRRQAYGRLHWMLGGSHFSESPVRAIRHIVQALFHDPRLAARVLQAVWRRVGGRRSTDPDRAVHG